ncbi:hypothetical protein BDW59DRAFT_164545 [Aspergillus cavernicola]|uniref:dihydropyrimidinase n=1 Tax=Aspergillus cavernicola TaxID=176166 RepID=A0ABR4HZE3_9EURO
MLDLIIKKRPYCELCCLTCASAVTAAEVLPFGTEIGVRDGKIAILGCGLEVGDATQIIDADGAFVTPGGADSHVHIEQDNAPTGDTWETGTRSSIAGGNTTVIAFATQKREEESLWPALEAYHKKAAGNAYCDYGFHFIITNPNELILNHELPGLVDQGITSIKLRLAEQGNTDSYFHSVARPQIAESEATYRAISLAEITDRKPRRDFRNVPNGVPGVETRLPLLFDRTVDQGNHEDGYIHISLPRFVQLTSTNPAKLYGLGDRKGNLLPGYDADIVIWYPEDVNESTPNGINGQATKGVNRSSVKPKTKRFTITNQNLHHRIDFTPFEGIKVRNWPRWVFLRGKLAWKRDG